MTCELNLVPLSCDRTGVGFTVRPLSADSNKLRLMKGHAKHFPVLEGGQYFYVRISGCSDCCELAKVVGIEDDTLILDRTTGTKCECIMSNSMVKYDWDNTAVVKDIASSIGINVLSPLKYDQCTRTLSVDCKELFAADCGGCGCGEGVVTPVGSTQPAGGLRGEKGDRGDAGIGVQSFKVTPAGMLSYTLTDGTTRTAGKLPVLQGIPGEQGPPGERGLQGEKGDSAPKVTHITMEGSKAVFHYADGESFQLDVTSLKGDKGDEGDKGDKGDKGDTGYSFQYVEVGNKSYIFGMANTTVQITSPQMPGVTMGPYQLDNNGFVEFDKPALSGNALIKLNVGGKLVGIGKSG